MLSKAHYHRRSRVGFAWALSGLICGFATIAAGAPPDGVSGGFFLKPVDDQEPEWLVMLHELARSPASEHIEQRLELANAPTELRRQLRLAKEERLPLTLTDWDPAPPAPRDNAAYDYAELTRLLERNPIPDDINFWAENPAGSAATPEHDAAVRRYYEVRTDIWPVLDRILTKRRCTYVADMRPLAAVEGPLSFAPPVRLPIFRRATRLVVVRARLVAMDGKYAEALDMLSRGAVIREHAACEPGFLGLINSRAVESILRSGVVSVIRLSLPDFGLADRATGVLAPWDRTAPFQRAVSGKCITLLDKMESIRRVGRVPTMSVMDFVSKVVGGGKDVSESSWTVALPRDGLTGDEWVLWDRLWLGVEARTIRESRRTLAASVLPPTLRSREFRRIRAEVAGRDDLPVSSAAHWQLTVDLPIELELLDDAEANDAVFRAGMAALRYFERYRRYPERLEEALDPVPQDPFDGKPIRYQPAAAGFVVYSIGAKRQNDGSPAKASSGGATFRWVTPKSWDA